MPIAEPELGGRHPAHLKGPLVEDQNPGEAVGDLDPVGADVLYRCRTGRTGNPREAFQPTEICLQRPNDNIVPFRPGLRPQRRSVDGDGRVRQPHDGEVCEIIGHHHVGAAAEHQHRVWAATVECAHGCDDLLGGLAGDHAPCDRADPQGCQRGHQHVLLDPGAAEIFPERHAR